MSLDQLLKYQGCFLFRCKKIICGFVGDICHLFDGKISSAKIYLCAVIIWKIFHDKIR